jgi:hypothetical protein
MPFELGPGSLPGGDFGIDVPPQEGDGAEAFGLSLQFEAEGVALGPPDADTLDFRDGITATRAGNKVTVSVPTTADAELIGGITADGSFDNWAAIMAAVAPNIGSFVAAQKPRAKFPTWGPIKVSNLLDIHPSVSFPNDGRGATVLVPGDNLPALTGPYPGQASAGGGAEAAFVRVARDQPDAAGSLAFSPVYRGLNLDARNTTQSNVVHGVRIPNPNPANNPNDADDNYSGNKDYVAGEWYNCDIIGWTGDGINVEGGNGRFHAHSLRCLNCDLYGMELSGNDVVLSGHWAVGGCGKFGLKLGQAAGCYATTGNMWSDPTQRSITCGSVWFDQRKYFVFMCSEFNDWTRLDGGTGDWTGGQISHCMMHQHGVNFDSDGVGHNALADGDTRLNSNIGVVEYKNVAFWGNTHVRTDPVGTQGVYTVDSTTDTFTTTKQNLANGTAVQVVPNAPTGVLCSPLKVNTTYYVRDYTLVGGDSTFKLAATLGGSAIDITDNGTASQSYTTFATLGNFGGFGLGGSFGTAPQTLIDASVGGNDNSTATGIGECYVSAFEPLCSAPDVKGWTDTIHSVEAVVNDGNGKMLIEKTAHGFQTNHRIGFYTMGVAPTGLTMNRTVYYVDIDNVSDPDNTFLLCVNPVENNNPTHLNFTDAGSGTLLYTSLSTFPFVQGHSNQFVYGFSDSYTCTWRFGALGPVLSHIALGINEDDDINPVYRVEIGDRGNFARNAMYGTFEFDHGITYRDNAFTPTTTSDGGNRQIKYPEPIHYFSTTGGGISSYTINFQTDNSANWEGFLSLTGGPIAQLNFGVTGGGSINTSAGSVKLPKSSPGALKIKFTYRRSTNDIRIHYVAAGAAGMPMGRTDNNAAETGVVGETQRDQKLVGNAVALSTGVAKTVHSLTLTPGRYLIIGSFGYNAASATGLTGTQWAISGTPDTLPTIKDESYGTQQYGSASVNSIFQVNMSFKLVNIPVGASDSVVTYYAVQEADFSGGSVSGFGTLMALRIN